jgi:hypothetical protein
MAFVKPEKTAPQAHPEKRKGYSKNRNPLKRLVGHEGFEPSTS